MRIIRRQKPQEPNYDPPYKYRPKYPIWDIRASHWANVVLTVGLLFVGLSQVFVTSKQAEIADTQATIAATQADIQRRQLALDGPLVSVSEVRFEGPEPTKVLDRLTFVIKNMGRSVAIVTDFSAVMRPQPLPNFPNYTKKFHLVVPPMAPGDTQRVDTSGSAMLPPGSIAIAPGISMIPQTMIPSMNGMAELEGIRNGAIPFNAYGFATYESGIDTLSGFGISGFCFHYVPLKDRGSQPQFVPCHEPNYTYTHHYPR